LEHFIFSTFLYRVLEKSWVKGCFKVKKSKFLFASIWVIAVGVVLAVIGSVIGGTWARYTLMNDVGFVMLWVGVGVLVFGAFGVITSFIKERFKMKKPKFLFASVWVIAVGVVLAVVGSVVGSTWARYTTMNDMGFAMLWVGVGVLVFGAFGIVSAFARARLDKETEPEVSSPLRLMIIGEPSEIIADGVSKSILTLQIVDIEGNPIAVSTDTPVKVFAGSGILEHPVLTIPKGESSEKTILVSSRKSGQVPVSADAEGLKSVTITLNFVEKKRYCMHCGALMPSKAKCCQNCGKSPPAGVDTKVCHNCKSVIPIVAKFCSECGSSQKE
jgi:ribosomal protein L40E